MTKERTKTSDESQVRRAVRQRERATREPKQEPKAKARKFLSTGSTMLNLAMSDNVDGGWQLGQIGTLPGQSSAGKTMLILSMFCEACMDSRLNKYRLIYDDVERRCSFDLKKLFGVATARLETPTGVKYADLDDVKPEEPTGISETMQQVEANLLLLRDKGEPFVYVVDSYDALTSDEELEKEMRRALAMAKSPEAAKKLAGSYDQEKVKLLGKTLRMIKAVVADTDSLFVMTQQTRQKINAMPGQKQWVTSGGNAPYFYSQQRPYLTRVKTHKDKGCEIGGRTKAAMDKSSVTGKLRDVEFDIYYDLGVDDAGSMVDFLLDQGHWKPGQWIEAPEFDLKENGRDKLTRTIEKVDNFRPVLKQLTQEAWDRREESLLLKRPSRYSR